MRFAIATLGCKVNQYDSALIETRLRARGFEPVPFDQEADVYLVNTCAVTERADAESLRLVRRARRLNARARVVMTGCLAQSNPAILARAAGVDYVVGLGLPEDLEQAVMGTAPAPVTVSNLRREAAPIELKALALEGHTRAFVKLQEGCDQFCSFCIVPTARGRSRSVPPRRVLETLDELAERGFQEVVLSGVHLGGYGKDLLPQVSLAGLLGMVAERCRLPRVRLSSLDPEELSDETIDLMAHAELFCPHLHLPLQGGDDEVLGRMRRRYDTAFYRARVERVLSAMPSAAVGTDVIAGFPGETAEQFARTLELLEDLPFAYLHVFPYSARAGTTAAKLAGRLAPAEVKRRAAVLRALGEGKRQRFVGRFCGSRLRVLFERELSGGLLEGYSRNYVRVTARAPRALVNREVEVKGSLVHGTALVGEIVWSGATQAPAVACC